MGILGNIISDISDIGSSNGKFKKKFTTLFKLLSDYSYGEIPYSKELGRQKIIVAFNELVEFSQVVNKNEIFKIYFRDRNIDLSVDVALKVADLWTTDILENDVKLSNTYAIISIDVIKNENI